MGSFEENAESKHRCTRFNEAIRAVVLERDGLRLRNNEVEKERDVLGEQVTRILNETPAFHGPQHEELAEPWLAPLFSKRSLEGLRCHMSMASLRSIPEKLVNSIQRLCCFLTKDPKSLTSTLRFFAITIAISIALLVFVSHKVLLWLIRRGFQCGHFLINLVVDTEELKSLCPAGFVRVWRKFVAFLKAVDNLVLRGNKHAGREWNVDAHLWSGGPEAQSRKDVLWKCPPPSARAGRRHALDAKYLPPEWSADTAKHVLAINFCYVSLRDDFVRRQLRYEKLAKEAAADRQSRRAAFTRAKSERFDTATLTKSGLVAPERRSSDIGGIIHEETSTVVKSTSTLESPQEIKIRSIMGELESIELVEPPNLSRPRAYSETNISDSCLDSEDDEVSISGFSTGSHPGFDGISPTTPRQNRRRIFSSETSLQSNESETDLNWLDVGTKIGMRLLNSEHVQKAMASQDTAERIIDLSKKVESRLKSGPNDRKESIEKAKRNNDNRLNASATIIGRIQESDGGNSSPVRSLGTIGMPVKPVHAMWTSPASAARQKSESSLGSDVSDLEDDLIATDAASPPVRNRKLLVSTDDAVLPPRSPHVLRDRKQPFGKVAAHSMAERSPRTRRYPLPVEVGPANKPQMRNSDNESAEYAAAEVGLNPVLLSPPDERRRNIQSESQQCANPQQSEPRDEIESRPCPKSFAGEGAKLQRRSLAKATSSPGTSKLPQPSHSPKSKLPKSTTRRANLQPGMKVVVPIFPIQPGLKWKPKGKNDSRFQMATVVKSKRIHLRTRGRRQQSGTSYTNCLSVTVKLDKSFLRGGEFAEMTFRVRDEWSSRYMPRHSKFPIGACVATSYGIGILVGWRVEDDCHVIRSLWQHRGAGTAHAYLNRDSLHGVMEAAVGFNVQTNLGRGSVIAYVHGGKDFRGGRYFVHIKEEGRHKGNVLEFTRSDILSCPGARFIPVIELIREAARYQLLVDNYNDALREQVTEHGDIKRPLSTDDLLWLSWSKKFDIIWSSFLKAVEEDKEFDQGMNNIFTAIIGFLEGLDDPCGKQEVKQMTPHTDNAPISSPEKEEADDDSDGDQATLDSSNETHKSTPGFWFLNDLFGGIFQNSPETTEEKSDVYSTASILSFSEQAVVVTNSSASYKQTFAIIRSLMRTVAIARTSCADEPNLRLALSIVYEFLIFVKTVVKVHQKNVTQQSITIWKRTLEEVITTIGPIKDRLHKIGTGIAERMEQHGRKAKVRIIRFVDIVLADETLMLALESGDWGTCVERVEIALVRSKIIDESSRQHYHKTIMFIYDHSTPSPSDESAAARNAKKLAALAHAMKLMASPRRSFLSLFRRDDFLELIERIFVRVFHKDDSASRMLIIHASNFQTLRQLRMLKDFTIAGKLWIPLLDAANEELNWAVSNMPVNARELMVPISKLFSLCVSQFHKLGAGDLTADWLSFLMEDAAVDLINEIDVKLILAVEAACKDIKEVMVVLPYYASIDDDILNLMDDFDVDEFLKEAADAIVDADKLTDFVREKATNAIERFLDYMPKMSIPVDRRELGDGWVLTCRGEDGGDLKLSDISIKREDLSCQVLGGETMFFPMFGNDDAGSVSVGSGLSWTGAHASKGTPVVETSILTHIREILVQAHANGYWEEGVGGVDKPPSDRYVASALGGMPVTSVLDCAIGLWRSLEIDDDELLEVAIRDVSYQIQLHNTQLKDGIAQGKTPKAGGKSKGRRSSRPAVATDEKLLDRRDNPPQRFNPRIDPTVLCFEMKKLTLNLERFHFRIEKLERLTFFDPVFEGLGTLQVRNFSMKLRVQCRKERITKFETDMTVPVLQLRELEIGLEKVKFKVKDTGADWILNQAVKGFSDNITEAVEANLKDGVRDQIRLALENLNSYFMVNPDLLLGILGITMGDLEENVVWV